MPSHCSTHLCSLKNILIASFILSCDSLFTCFLNHTMGRFEGLWNCLRLLKAAMRFFSICLIVNACFGASESESEHEPEPELEDFWQRDFAADEDEDRYAVIDARNSSSDDRRFQAARNSACWIDKVEFAAAMPTIACHLVIVTMKRSMSHV